MKKSILASMLLLLTSFATHAQTASDHIPEGFSSAKMTSSHINLHYVRDGGSGEAVILLHGWPQTWESWVEVMPLLQEQYDVIAVDLRGSGDSDKPESGYDKKTMAADIKALMDELDIAQANIVGHDIGGMTAFAFASQFPDRTATLTILDVPIPGTKMFEEISSDPRAWHFSFHAAPDIPEKLTAGKEEYYYGHFMRQFDAGAGGITDKEIKITVDAFSDPLNARAGFNWYRAFAQDVIDNKAFMESQLEVPVLGLTAQRLSPFPYIVESLTPFVKTIEGGTMDSGHWIPETLPNELSEKLNTFFQKY